MKQDKLPIKVLVVYPHELTRIGIRHALKNQPEIELIDEFENTEQAVHFATQHKPDLILMGIRDSLPEDIQAIDYIKAYDTSIKILIFTAQQDIDSVYQVLAAGADGYCLKKASSDKLVNVIHLVMQGVLWIEPTIIRQMAQTYLTQYTRSESLIIPEKRLVETHDAINLTKREQETLTLIAEGKTNKEIAEILGITIHTVKVYLRNLSQKMAVYDRTQLALKAVKGEISCGSFLQPSVLASTDKAPENN